MKSTVDVLLVDESPFFLSIEKQFLRKSSVEVREARTAAAALNLIAEKVPDMIYMSYDLPDRSGADVCRQLKADRKLRAIPLVLVCNEQNLDHQQQGRAAGCDALLTKPLDRHRFLEIGRSFLSGIREQRRSCLIRVRARSGEQLFIAKGLDISRGGIFLECTEQLKPGTLLQLELQLSRPTEQGPWVSVTGVVAWLNTKEKPFKPNHPVGCGIKFVEIPTDLANQFYAFLRTVEK